MGRVTRPSAQRGRLLWTTAAVGVALVVALGMLVADLADNAEVVATLLLAPIVVAALWVGRNVALGVAGGAAVIYAGLRAGDVDGVGAAGVAVLILARAAVFAAVAWFAPVVAPLLPGFDPSRRPQHRAPAPRVPGPAAGVDQGSLPSPTSALAELGGGHSRGHHFSGAEAAPPAGFGGRSEQASAGAWGDQGDDEWDEAGEDDDGWEGDLAVPPTPQWEEPLTPPTEAWGDEQEPLGAPAATGGHAGALEPVAWDHPTDPGVATGNGGHWDDDEVPGEVVMASSTAGWDEPAEQGPSEWDEVDDQRSPQVPTGWADDEVDLHGDHSIPVGYTGELFLPPDLAMAPGDVVSIEPPTGNGWTGPADRPAPPGYPAASPPERARRGGGRRPAPPEPVPAGPPASPMVSSVDVAGTPHTPTQDPETRLWNARFFRERLTTEVEAARQAQTTFSVVLVQVPDEPFRALPYRRQVALLRELGHQFVAARVVDHLVHLPDGDRHWFAVILAETDRPAAQDFETRLRTAIGGYLRHRGLQVQGIESASMTSPDDDELMADVWASLLGSEASSPDSSRGAW
jgi:hypothetical protein